MNSWSTYLLAELVAQASVPNLLYLEANLMIQRRIICFDFFFLLPRLGGRSHGCPENAGGAGTLYDKSLQTLKVSNDNFTTHTETPLLGFAVSVVWSNVLVEGAAQVLVPLLWTRVQVSSFICLHHIFVWYISFKAISCASPILP